MHTFNTILIQETIYQFLNYMESTFKFTEIDNMEFQQLYLLVFLNFTFA